MKKMWWKHRFEPFQLGQQILMEKKNGEKNVFEPFQLGQQILMEKKKKKCVKPFPNPKTSGTCLHR